MADLEPTPGERNDHEERQAGERAASKWTLRGWPWLLLAVVVSLGLGAGLWNVLKPVSVEISVARTGQAIESVYASGIVDFVRQAKIAPVVNVPIRAVRVTEGQTVRAGQPLVDLVAGAEEATALQLAAQATQARSAFNRVDRLYRQSFASPAAREDAMREYEAAEAAARAGRERLRDFHITAPFAGRILRRDAEPGNMAQVGVPLIVIADPSSLRITADIDERDAGRVRPGLHALAHADAFPGQQFPARVTEFTPQGDPAARVFRARLGLDPNSLLRPGMTVEINIVLDRRDDAVLAPRTAVRNGAIWVLVDHRARRRKVVTGIQDSNQIEIVSGVRSGEQVIISPPASLKDGARVSARAAAG